jgi:hypothetical protein
LLETANLHDGKLAPYFHCINKKLRKALSNILLKQKQFIVTGANLKLAVYILCPTNVNLQLIW